MNTLFSMLVTLVLGFVVFLVLIPHGNRAFVQQLLAEEVRRFKNLSQAGGYVHDTAMCQFIPPNAIHCVTGTWTWTAGPTAGTISAHKAAAAETTTINVPILIPSNAVSGKGSYLKYVELDYEITTSAATSVTLTMNKVTLGSDTNAPSVASVTGTQTLTPATTAATVDQHRDRFTLTTPAWIGDGEQYLLKCAAVCAAGTVLDILGARAYYTSRL